MTTKVQLAQYCADHFPTHMSHGVTMFSAFVASSIALAAGFGIGWYIKGRGVAGVQIDASNAKNEVEKVAAAV